MNSIEVDIKLISKVWGSEEAARSYLEAETRRLTPVVCGPDLPVPETEIRPTMMARGIPGLGGSLRSAEYEIAEDDRPATIILFPSALTDKQTPTTAIAHELIHHWERTLVFSDQILEYPSESEPIIQTAFKDKTKERSWRSGHSARFVKRAMEIAKILDIPLLQMLAHR